MLNIEQLQQRFSGQKKAKKALIYAFQQPFSIALSW